MATRWLDCRSCQSRIHSEMMGVQFVEAFALALGHNTVVKVCRHICTGLLEMSSGVHVTQHTAVVTGNIGVDPES